MKKLLILVSVFVLVTFISVTFFADDFRIPRDRDSGAFAENLDYVGVNYKLISHTVTQTEVITTPGIVYGVVFGTAAANGNYVTFLDSTTASTAGEMFVVYLDTNTVTAGGNSTRIVKLAQPVQTTKGIYSTNSANTFKSTVLYRKLKY